MAPTSLVIKRSTLSLERLLAPGGEEIVSEIVSLDLEDDVLPMGATFDVVFVEVENVAVAASWIERATALSPRPTIVAVAVAIKELRAKDGFRLRRAGADALVSMDPLPA
jgi:hypothetical protein